MTPAVSSILFTATLLLSAGAYAAEPPAASAASASASAAAGASAAASVPAPVPLDIEAMKKSLRDAPALFPETGKPAQADFGGGPPRNKRFEEQMRRAIPPDCRKAYAGIGLFAIVPLIFSTVTGIGCKW